MPTDLLVIGDCSIDEYMMIEQPHLIGEQICFLHGSKVPVKKFSRTLAGNVTHVGIGAQRLGMQTVIYTELGADADGDKFITEFKKQGIDTTYCRQNRGKSTNVHAIIVYAGERTIFSYHEPYDYSFSFDKLKGAKKPKWLYYTSLADGFENFQEKLVRFLAANSDVAVAFNPGTVQLKAGTEKLKNILALTHVLFVNKDEAIRLTEFADVHKNGKLIMEDRAEQENNTLLKDLHAKLVSMGPKISVITDGANGSSVFDGNKLLEKAAPVIEGGVVDKTGAGDAYAVGFLAALHYKKKLSEAMDWGNKNSASTVQMIGAVDGLLTKKEIEK